jgi:hypothetical protein
MPIAPMTRTVQQVIDRVTRQFGDESGAQITNEDIIRWINSGQNEINRRNRILKDTAVTPLVIGTRSYTFPSVNILEIEALHIDGRPIDHRSFKEAQQNVLANDPTFTQTGTPWMWYEWGASILLYPTPDAALNMTLYYVKYATDVVLVTDILSIPDSYYDALISFCLKEAYEQDDDWTGSANKQQQFTDSTAMLAEDGRSYERELYPTITDVDEDYWNWSWNG